MQKRHLDPQRYFNEQASSTQKYVLPFIEKKLTIDKVLQVLEIGCGEAGNLKPFLELGCKCTGVDLSTSKIEKGKTYYASHPKVDNLRLISEDIYKTKDFHSQFDIVIIRDVIEHIHDQDKFLGLLKDLLTPKALVFVAFPPWQSPFGGHQQVCENKLLSLFPYFHLLPVPLYKLILKMFGESNAKIDGLIEIKETGISLEHFENLAKKNDYSILLKTLYFINPNYEVKFGLKPRILNDMMAKIPYFRNYVCTCGYYLIGKNHQY